MKERFIPILSGLMTISLIVFVGLQIFWLKQAIDDGEQDFSSRVYKALNNSSKKINTIEINKFYKPFTNFYQDINNQKDSSTIQTAMSVIDSQSVKYIIYKKTIVNKKPLIIPFSKKDTLKITNLLTDEGVLKIKKDSLHPNIKPIEKNIENSFVSPKFTLDEFARLSVNQMSLESRINMQLIDSVVNLELKKHNIDTDFKCGVLNNKLQLTKIHSDDFILSNKFTQNYNVVLFSDGKDTTQYYLSVYFPSKQYSVLNPILGAIGVTVASTLVIIAIYIASIYYMSQQKKISEIKTDFINNMSHEFKTPIATINIATDALNSEKVQSEPEKMKFYTSLIKQENERMKKQVEMVLQMSKLERNALQLIKKETDIRQILKNSIKTVRVQVEQRGGTIKEQYLAEKYVGNVDGFHLTNTFVNILDNANKYSLEKPEISVKTYNEKNDYVVEIADKGKGMSENVIKKIFEKFYREETGNIHNVKGHGLGLAYVKNIINLHNGGIKVVSKLHKGTTFIVRIPLK
ncbi:two-component system, OmpR family, phosphate regulon sensor histidine kinase PhoR [Apibacter mensalis]|uniref:histidine kinase n=1 Tax=Apibacter mensalis TaxID=1586267 RepID=A0A110BK20_9FLAO|nr:HAMP domain-containing sensor histidine kinase [Apibacter mensalis]CVK15749.1 two-component system, OmpR family, phosphate regulon sensor histidine kinase PhoR [Apibacter mensalis]